MGFSEILEFFGDLAGDLDPKKKRISKGDGEWWLVIWFSPPASVYDLRALRPEMIMSREQLGAGDTPEESYGSACATGL
jgi:hypothetical protein